MLERKELNDLVIMTLQTTQVSLKASQIYEQIKQEDPSIMRGQSVKSFRSFVKILNSFPNVQPTGSGTKTYMICKIL